MLGRAGRAWECTLEEGELWGPSAGGRGAARFSGGEQGAIDTGRNEMEREEHLFSKCIGLLALAETGD